MKQILPQQRLLLELIKMSGDIAVPDADDGSMLYRTLMECKDNHWVMVKQFGAGFCKASITPSGRNMTDGPICAPSDIKPSGSL